jgi:hypothetical protein
MDWQCWLSPGLVQNLIPLFLTLITSQKSVEKVSIVSLIRWAPEFSTIPDCSRKWGASLISWVTLVLECSPLHLNFSNTVVKETVYSFHLIFMYCLPFPLSSSQSPALPLQRLLKHSWLSYINCVVEPSAPHLSKSCWAISSFIYWDPVEPSASLSIEVLLSC